MSKSFISKNSAINDLIVAFPGSVARIKKLEENLERLAKDNDLLLRHLEESKAEVERFKQMQRTTMEYLGISTSVVSSSQDLNSSK